MSQDREHQPLDMPLPEQSPRAAADHFSIVRRFSALAVASALTIGAFQANPHDSESTGFRLMAEEVTPEPTSAVFDPSPEDSYIVSTYNVKASIFRSPLPLAQRMRYVSDIVSGEDRAPRTSVGILQEVLTDKGQYSLLDKYLSRKGYDLYPSASEMNTNVVAYDTDRFKFINGGIVRYPFYGDRRINGRWEKSGKAAWAFLEDKDTHQRIATIGARLVAWNEDRGSDPGGAQKRRAGAVALRKWAIGFQKSHPASIVTIANDDNAKNYLRNKYGVNWTTDNPDVRQKDDVLESRKGLPYCEQTEYPAFLQNAKDSVYGMYGHCPDTSHSGRIYDSTADQEPNWALSKRNEINIDAVYYSPRTAAAADWDQNVSRLGRKASDHFLLWTKLVARHAIFDGNIRELVLSEQTKIPQ